MPPQVSRSCFGPTWAKRCWRSSRLVTLSSSPLPTFSSRRRAPSGGWSAPASSNEIAVRRLAQLVTPAALDDLIVDAWGLRHNLTVADALYIVLTRRTGAALMSTDERMLGAPGLDDIELVRH
jgi:hypothetical protein